MIFNLDNDARNIETPDNVTFFFLVKCFHKQLTIRFVMPQEFATIFSACSYSNHCYGQTGVEGTYLPIFCATFLCVGVTHASPYQ